MSTSEGVDARRVADALKAATTAVFADMAFIDAACVAEVPAEETREARPGLEVRAAIDILKPLSCRLELRMPRALSDTIKETLGSGDAADASDGPPTDDAVLEMVNVLAGAFLSEYFGPGASIKLELPLYLFEGAEDGGEPLAALRYDAEGKPFEAYIHSVRYRY